MTTYGIRKDGLVRVHKTSRSTFSFIVSESKSSQSLSKAPISSRDFPFIVYLCIWVFPASK